MLNCIQNHFGFILKESILPLGTKSFTRATSTPDSKGQWKMVPVGVFTPINSWPATVKEACYDQKEPLTLFAATYFH